MGYFELYIIGSGMYPLISIAHAIAMKSKYEETIFECKGDAEGKELFVQETHTQMPVYAGNQNVHIPIGGGTSTEWKSIINIHQIDNKYYINFSPYDDEPFYTNTTYLNSYEEALQLLRTYNYEKKVPIQIPMKVRHTFIPGPKIYLDKHTGYMDNNRIQLIKDIMWKRRLPGTFTIPLVAGIIGLGYWVLPATPYK